MLWKPTIESLLFVSGDEGISRAELSAILEMDEEKILQIMNSMKAIYQEDIYGIQINEFANRYRFVTKKEHVKYLKKLVNTPINKSLSRAALETVAIIAYKQPITKLEIEAIRGVAIEASLQKLLARGLICEVGRTKGLGRAILYGTTVEFLDYFGLSSLEELPQLDEQDENAEKETDLFEVPQR